MKKIQKTISLETLTSRVPSIWPAYKNNKLYFFDDASLKAQDRQYDYTSNYGMIPLNVSGHTPFFDGREDYTMSFERLSNRYAFMKRYNHLLKHEGHCGLSYTSATSFYDSEINSKYGDNLPYGNSRDTYEELDVTYKEYGGDDFYNWICTNVIPTYHISDEYKDYWNRDVLYYPDVIKWMAWFKDRLYYEDSAHYTSKTDDDIEHWDCQSSGVSDCCDCEEYFNRGGKREYDSMEAWYNSVQRAITSIRTAVLKNNEVLSAYSPSLDDKVELSNSLSDMGQFSILSPELEMGKEYRTIPTEENNSKTIIHYESGNTNSGTTVIDGEDSKILIKGSGFCYSADYMEMLIKEDDWGDYTEYYIKNNPNEFVSSAYTYYAFDENNVMYSGNSEDAVKSAMSSTTYYDVTSANTVLIDGVLYDIETYEYGDYTNQLGKTKRYFVQREENTNTPYVIMNGKTIYADSYLHPTSGLCYYFSFFKVDNVQNEESCHSDGKTFDINQYKIFRRTKSNDLATNLKYRGKLYDVTTFSSITIGMESYSSETVTYSAFTIDSINYPIINAYTTDNEGNTMFLVNNIPDVFDVNLMQIDDVYFKDNKVYVNKYNKNIKVYKANELVGTTSSKLTSLKAINTLVDDVGNKIEGLYNDTCRKLNDLPTSGTYAQPPIYTVLEPSYQVGNVAMLEKLYDEPNSGSCCIGNILTSMVFYFKDVNGNVVDETKVTCSDSISSLSAITQSIGKKNSSSSTIVFDDTIYCDMKYYIGATLKKSDGKLKLAEEYNYGVEYNETVRFVKKQVFFYLTKEEEEVEPTQFYNPTNTNVKYPIYIYDVEQDVEDTETDSIPLAQFKTEINIISGDSLTPNFDNYKDMNPYENVKVSPVYKEEYKIGLSSMENIDADIYIDRGINAAFEKHLKLGEVTSMEALENYGNNYFNIMKI